MNTAYALRRFGSHYPDCEPHSLDEARRLNHGGSRRVTVVPTERSAVILCRLGGSNGLWRVGNGVEPYRKASKGHQFTERPGLEPLPYEPAVFSVYEPVNWDGDLGYDRSLWFPIGFKSFWLSWTTDDLMFAWFDTMRAALAAWDDGERSIHEQRNKVVTDRAIPTTNIVGGAVFTYNDGGVNARVSVERLPDLMSGIATAWRLGGGQGELQSTVRALAGVK